MGHNAAMVAARPDLSTVGFIGLGVMGLPMARNVLGAGYELVVHTRTAARARSLEEAGAAVAASPAAVAEAVDIVITMLPDTPDVEQVAEGDDGLFAGASAGLVWIDMSSISPTTSTALAPRAAAHGVAMIDAPVSGGETGAEAGTLSIMVGGDEATFERCVPLLRTMGSSVVRVGGPGAGQVAKACNQIVVGCTLAGVAEALVLAAKAGVDAGKVREVLLGGFAQSRILDVHGERMLSGNFAPGFRASLHRKDLVNALAAGRAYGSSLLLSSLVAELLGAQVAAGDGDLDHSALVKVYEALAGARLA